LLCICPVVGRAYLGRGDRVVIVLKRRVTHVVLIISLRGPPLSLTLSLSLSLSKQDEGGRAHGFDASPNGSGERRVPPEQKSWCERLEAALRELEREDVMGRLLACYAAEKAAGKEGDRGGGGGGGGGGGCDGGRSAGCGNGENACDGS